MAFSETENEKRGFRFPSFRNRLRDCGMPHVHVREHNHETIQRL
jgi:hypothetical protein